MPKTPKQPVSIDGIEFDALIEQSTEYSAEVPEYPTEKGFNVSDTIIISPETISMTLYVTDTPVTWKKRFGATNFQRVDDVEKRLEQLFMSRKLVTVVTSDAVYEDMALLSYSISKSADVGYAREIPITLKKIIRTESKTVTISSGYGKSGATGASAGTANTSSSSSSGSSNTKNSNSESGSILYNVSKNVGLI